MGQAGTRSTHSKSSKVDKVSYHFGTTPITKVVMESKHISRNVNVSVRKVRMIIPEIKKFTPVMALIKLDILNYQLMKGTRAHAVVGIAVFSAIITPTQDALTMGLMVGPLYCLYEACIWIARYMDKKDRELYPEYYKDLEKDEAAMKAEDSWDNEDYNPWSTADDDDDEGLKKKDESKPSSDESSTPSDQPETEKSLEDYAREDERRTNTD